MTNTELARHIYFYSQSCKSELPSGQIWSEHDDRMAINYIANLMELHFEPQNHLGSKGFESVSTRNNNKENSPIFGC
jgi:hypothetical protein